jgi:hypothetical protein
MSVAVYGYPIELVNMIYVPLNISSGNLFLAVVFHKFLPSPNSKNLTSRKVSLIRWSFDETDKDIPY